MQKRKHKIFGGKCRRSDSLEGAEFEGCQCVSAVETWGVHVDWHHGSGLNVYVPPSKTATYKTPFGAALPRLTGITVWSTPGILFSRNVSGLPEAEPASPVKLIQVCFFFFFSFPKACFISPAGFYEGIFHWLTGSAERGNPSLHGLVGMTDANMLLLTIDTDAIAALTHLHRACMSVYVWVWVWERERESFVTLHVLKLLQGH